ncbi:MAG: hypothetical protein HY525_11560 [Betaproteobacteria bacterium]|nr:hypothetical protein [Betaproteobacteria bacterium]
MKSETPCNKAGSPGARAPSIGTVWLAFFVFSAVIAGLVQFFVLPHLLSSSHGGNGLFTGTDAVVFHDIAARMAAAIRTVGWSAWRLAPENQAPAGIAAAVYALTVPQPWTFIPINAALHATAGVALILIVESITQSYRAALCAALPFVLYPSAAQWYAQIHKDGFYIAGMLLYLYGWLLLARPGIWKSSLSVIARPMALIIVGLGLVWIVRPYGIQLMQGVTLIFAVVFAIVLVRAAIRGATSWGIVLPVIVLCVAFPLLGLTAKDDRLSIEAPDMNIDRASLVTTAPNRAAATLAASWLPTDWLPKQTENAFFNIARARTSFVQSYPGAGSNIDTQIAFSQAGDFIGYLPRAVQIGFFAPFPGGWLEQKAAPAASVMGRIAAVEMLGVYAALLFLPYALWAWRRRLEIWLTLIFCGAMIVAYAYAIPNVGALYRMRYGFMMTLVALGVAGALTAWRDLRARRAHPTGGAA